MAGGITKIIVIGTGERLRTPGAAGDLHTFSKCVTHYDRFSPAVCNLPWVLPQAIAAVGSDTSSRRSRRVPAPPFCPSASGGSTDKQDEKRNPPP